MGQDVLKEWLGLIAVILSIGGIVYAWLTSGSKKNGDAIAKMQAEALALANRVQMLEGEMRHLPDNKTTHRLELALAEVNGRLGQMDERLKPVAVIGERLQELLLQQVRK